MSAERFEGPDCGELGCRREVGHIGEHRTWLDQPAPRSPFEDLEDENVDLRMTIAAASAEIVRLRGESPEAPWTRTEQRAVASQVGLPYGWTARVRSDTVGNAVVRAAVARTPGGHTAEPLPCGHRSVQGTGRTVALAVARLAGWVRFHREDCAE